VTPIWFLTNYNCWGFNYFTLYTVKYKKMGIAFRGLGAKLLYLLIQNEVVTIVLHQALDLWQLLLILILIIIHQFTYLVHHVINECSCGLVCLVYVHDPAGHEHVNVVVFHDGRAATPQRHDDSQGPHALTLTLGQTSTHMIDATSMVTVQVTGKEILQQSHTNYWKGWYHLSVQNFFLMVSPKYRWNCEFCQDFQT